MNSKAQPDSLFFYSWQADHPGEISTTFEHLLCAFKLSAEVIWSRQVSCGSHWDRENPVLSRILVAT
jgi:hypothetical protein